MNFHRVNTTSTWIKTQNFRPQTLPNRPLSVTVHPSSPKQPLSWHLTQYIKLCLFWKLLQVKHGWSFLFLDIVLSSDLHLHSTSWEIAIFNNYSTSNILFAIIPLSHHSLHMIQWSLFKISLTLLSLWKHQVFRVLTVHHLFCALTPPGWS